MARLGNLLALLSTALLATESFAAKRTFAKKKGKTQMWITIIVVVGTTGKAFEHELLLGGPRPLGPPRPTQWVAGPPC